MAKNIPLFTFVFAAYAAIRKNPSENFESDKKIGKLYAENVFDLFKTHKGMKSLSYSPFENKSIRREIASKSTILVVDDDSLVRFSIIQMAEREGFEVLNAVNVQEAISTLEARRDVQIVFIDMMMPGLIDGMGLARNVRNHWPQIEIILTSGYREVSTFDLPGKCLFIKKPFETQRIVSIFRGLAKNG